ncbi:MAG: hypothetical protein IKB23_07370, partial [Clostridia bacterium]|nr:hypothetical protein [Clostridia bacterium]
MAAILSKDKNRRSTGRKLHKRAVKRKKALSAKTSVTNPQAYERTLHEICAKNPPFDSRDDTV